MGQASRTERKELEQIPCESVSISAQKSGQKAIFSDSACLPIFWQPRFSNIGMTPLTKAQKEEKVDTENSHARIHRRLDEHRISRIHDRLNCLSKEARSVHTDAETR